eukprot:symbB.v1.2.038460.t1/scaffold5997.1/size21888/2
MVRVVTSAKRADDERVFVPVTNNDGWKSVRHGRVSWGKEQVEQLARSLLHNLPARAKALIAQKTMAHSHMVLLQDPDGVSRPTYKDIAVNFIWLKPICEVFPDRVPSQFFMTDVILMLNLFLDSKLLLVAGESEMEMYPDQETK